MCVCNAAHCPFTRLYEELTQKSGLPCFTTIPKEVLTWARNSACSVITNSKRQEAAKIEHTYKHIKKIIEKYYIKH